MTQHEWSIAIYAFTFGVIATTAAALLGEWIASRWFQVSDYRKET